MPEEKKVIEDPFEFANGIFEWSHLTNSLHFHSYEQAPIVEDLVQKKFTPKTDTTAEKYVIDFKDDIDIADKLNFSRKYRRKINEFDPKDPRVILLQDVKDVVLFTANPKHLTSGLVMYLHHPNVDNFFRALIVYFQFYFQTWDELRNRREELERKIPLPNVKNTASEDLGFLRAITAKTLSTIKSDRAKFHSSSTIERDRQSCEAFANFSVRMVWHALNKPSLAMIEQEIDRLSRSDHFNKYEHAHILSKRPTQSFTESERRILRGRNDKLEKRLNAKSPVMKELLYGAQDHRFLAIGMIDFPPSDERLRYMEKLYLLPEEDFKENGICIGILGMPRDQFDVMLKPKRRKMHDDESDFFDLTFHMEIPPYIHHSDDEVPWIYPTAPPRIKQDVRMHLLMHQSSLWIQRIQSAFLKDNSAKDFTVDSCTSSVL